ncbi:MAG: monoamine oxidase [Paracrocinitomix sp.]|jgi:monoamine oxidase
MGTDEVVYTLRSDLRKYARAPKGLCSVDKEDVVVDVAVIGAGPAGLYAAALVQQAGHSVRVLEGRDRVGGRLLSVQAPGGRLDLGATWFWSNETRVNNVVAAASLGAFPQHLAGDAMFQNDQGIQRMQGNQVDAPSGRLVDGTQSIAEALTVRLADGVIHLNTIVESAVAVPNGLAIATVKGSWVARQLIIAVPPATAVARINFGGQLSERVYGLASSTPVWMGNIVKVVAHYDRPFWREAGLAGSAFSYTGPMREIHDMSGADGSPAAIFGFAQPGSGVEAPNEAQVVAQLVDLFGPQAAVPDRLFIQDWRAEPLTSPDNADELTNYQTYGHPIFAEPVLDGRAHWASTETATTAPGHIEGAFQAAERAAHAALAGLAARADGIV